jgi:hypothetical protein
MSAQIRNATKCRSDPLRSQRNRRRGSSEEITLSKGVDEIQEVDS